MRKLSELYDKFKKNDKSDDIEVNLDDIEVKLDNRAKVCLNYLEQNPDKDIHRVDFDQIFLSGYSMIKGSKKIEKFTNKLLWLTFILLLFTTVLIGLAIYEIPDYPIYGQSIEPISSHTYIDRGTDLVHETDYLIKISKFIPSYNIDIKLLTDVQGFYEICDTRGYDFKPYVNSTSKTIEINNIEKINPVFLRVIYVERSINSDIPSIIIRPLPPNTNESFYLVVKNSGYDIKYARKNYNIIEYANLFLNTTIYDSWKNKSFIIYENDIPTYMGTINQDGTTNIDIRSLKEGECITYLIKKCNYSAMHKCYR